MTAHVAEVQCARCGTWHPVEDACGCVEASWMWWCPACGNGASGYESQSQAAAAEAAHWCLMSPGGRSSEGSSRTATGTNGGDQ